MNFLERRRRSYPIQLLLAFFLSLSIFSPALLGVEENQSAATVCQWPSAVKAGGSCTGVYVGGGLMITAAHCLSPTPISTGPYAGKYRLDSFQKAGFGEYLRTAVHWNQAEVEGRVREVLFCEPYPGGDFVTAPNGNPSFDGVDLAFCVLNSGWSGSVAPILVPGCESDYLSYRIFRTTQPRMVAVGMGCNDGQCSEPGRKRFWDTRLDPDRPVAPWNGSEKLRHDLEMDEAPLLLGDSGGPLFVRMADGTWRVIGIYHGGGVHEYWEQVPPYLRWIEETSGRDITRCHTWDDTEGHYVFDNVTLDCTDESGFVIDPEATSNWNLSCLQPEGGGADACAGWPGPNSIVDIPTLSQTGQAILVAGFLLLALLRLRHRAQL